MNWHPYNTFRIESVTFPHVTQQLPGERSWNRPSLFGNFPLGPTTLDIVEAVKCIFGLLFPLTEKARLNSTFGSVPESYCMRWIRVLASSSLQRVWRFLHQIGSFGFSMIENLFSTWRRVEIRASCEFDRSDIFNEHIHLPRRRLFEKSLTK